MDVSAEKAAQFQRDGFLVVENIIPKSQVEQLNAAVNRVFEGQYNRDVRPPALRKSISLLGEDRQMRWTMHARLVDDDLWRLATDPTLGRTAARLLQAPSVSMIEDQILVKPGKGAPFTLHQDHTYWGFSTATNTLTCWLALSDMTAEMGPIEVVRGSHLWGLADRKLGAKESVKDSDADYLSDLRLLNLDRPELELVPAIVPAGGGVFFRGSKGNSTQRWRRAVALHWAGSSCHLDAAKLQSHPLVYSS